MSEIADRYRRHADAFERKVVAVRPEQWANQSPCEAWDARGVMGHIVVMHGVMCGRSTAS
jgi:Mycothiol maleylpyruvate isomerase N-terminal domain